MDLGYCYSFPATRGMQAGKPFYIAMCPMRIIPRIFIFDEEEVPPQLRAQRRLNKQRIPAIVRYLVDKPQEYILSALTASIDASVKFESVDPDGRNANIGTLSIPMDARILINDGQHRRAAIEEAIKENPDLGHDNIAVLFFVDEGLSRSQQMFVDLNMHQVRPDQSLITLYNHSDQESSVATEIALNCAPFVGLTDLESSSLSAKSNKLFTLSSIKHANRALLKKGRRDRYSKEEIELIKQFWEHLASVLPHWDLVKKGKVAAGAIREEYILSHGVILQALGTLGSNLLSLYPAEWPHYLDRLKEIDWSKDAELWQGRALQLGRIVKSRNSMQLTVNALKHFLGLELSEDESALENEFINGR